MYSKKIIVALLFASLFSIKSFSQFSATWAFTANNTGAKTGAQSADVNINDAAIGSVFTANVGYSSNGVKCQPSSEWPIVPTDGWNIDFPLSPNGAVDITINGLSFTGRTSGSSNNNVVSLAYQADGIGPFIPFGTTQIVPSGGTNTITFPAFTKKFYSTHSYIIRMYMYAATTGISASRSLSVKTAVFTGTSNVAGTQPSVTTTSAIKTGKYTATATGVVNAGSLSVTESGVVWDINSNPTVALATKNSGGPTASGNINLSSGGAISGLTAATTYHARAYVISESGNVFYGTDLSFTTDAPSIASLTTNPATSITSIKAVSGGIILDSGGVAITKKGVCWGTSANPDTFSSKTNDGFGNSNFISSLKILTPNTLYHARAYAVNSVGIAYGNDISFTTLTSQPVIITTTGNSANTIPFGSVIVNNISSVKSYQLSASALLPVNGNITITAPVGFEVSLSPGTGFGSTLSIGYTGSTVVATTIYVRFVPTLFGDYSGVITHAGGSATATNIDDVNVTGKGIQNPGDFSNTGTDFWVGYGFQALMTGSNNQEMVLYVSSKQNAIVTVEIGKPTDANYYIQTYNVVANTATSTIPLPKNGVQDARLNSTGILPRGIHVYSNGVPFSLWEHIYAGSSSGASLILPTNTWGSNYSVLTVGGKTNNGVPHSFFYVQAAEDNTIVDITPADDITATAGGTTVLYPAGVPFSITLNKGDVFNALGKLITSSIGVDLTGTTVVSRDCNKKIALFTGNGRVQLFVGGCTSTNGGSDNFLQQMFPKQAWGTKYVTSPFRDMEAGLYKVIVSDPSTVVTVNGTTLTSLVQNAYTIETDTLLDIKSDKPVMVAQFCATNKCNGTGIPTHPNTGDNGDPEMVIISPVQQAINDVTVYSTNNYNIQHNYINVIIPNAGVASFLFDGVSASAAFNTHTADPNYSYAVFDNLTGNTSHRLQSDIAFNAIAYGFSTSTTNESYGYNAGTNIKSLSQYLSVQNTYANVSNDSIISACLNNDFKYTLSLPYKPISMKWDFFNNTVQQPNSDTVFVANPIPTDSSIVGGVMLYKYSLPTTYQFTTTGIFPVNITVNATNADGCTGLQTITFSVKVVAPPTPYFLLDYNPCLPTILNFTDSSYDKNGYRMVGREWTFLGLSPILTSSDSTPTISYGSAGNYDVKLRAINDIGCFKDTTATIVLYNGPVISNIASNPSGPTCVGTSVTYTATATTSLGTIAKYYWDFGDGKKDTTTVNTVSHTFTAANTTGYTVSLIIESTAGCYSGFYDILQQVYKINADFTFTTPQCVNTSVAFTNTTTGGVTSALIDTKWDWSFGDPLNSTSNTMSPSFTYTTPNVYNVKLRASLVLLAGGEFCADSITKQITISSIVSITNITADNNGPDCANRAITYTAVSAAPVGAFKWYWEFSDGTKDTTTTNQVSHIFTSANSYTIKVFAKSISGGCVGNQFVINQVIYKIGADFTYITPQCVNSSVLFTDVSTGKVSNATVDTRWKWSFGDAANSTANTNNPTFNYNTAGTYNVKLKASLFNIGGADFCVDSITKPIVIQNKLSKPTVTLNTGVTTSTSLTFNWLAVANALTYQVSTNNGATWNTPSSGSTGTTHTLTGLTTNTVYDLCVQALGTCPSDTACAQGKTISPNSDFFVPSGFTPNGQGPNEKLVICGNNVKSIRFMVFTQWGEKVFETSNPTINGIGCYETWDGTAFGKPQPVGVYAYVANITLNDGSVVNKKGLVSLIR